MKKVIAGILAVSMLLMLTGCGHTHAGGDWQLFALKHGKICSCGQIYDAGEHTLDELSVCTVCGAEVFVWDDGADVSLRDDHGSLIRTISYDAEGNVVCDIRIDCTYDDNGNLRSEMRYVDDILEQESAYEDGMLATQIEYFEDGTYAISLYNEMGPCSLVNYDAEGKIISEYYSEYAYDANGIVYEVRSTTVDADGSRYVGEFNELGDQIAWVTYDPDGNVEHNERYEITYDDEGRKDTVKTYEGDVLVEEKIYTLVTFDDGWMNYPGTIIEYFVDGTKTVTEYDDNDEVISRVTYDADGNVIE